MGNLVKNPLRKVAFDRFSAVKSVVVAPPVTNNLRTLGGNRLVTATGNPLVHT